MKYTKSRSYKKSIEEITKYLLDEHGQTKPTTREFWYTIFPLRND